MIPRTPQAVEYRPGLDCWRCERPLPGLRWWWVYSDPAICYPCARQVYLFPSDGVSVARTYRTEARHD